MKNAFDQAVRNVVREEFKSFFHGFFQKPEPKIVRRRIKGRKKTLLKPTDRRLKENRV